MLKITKKDGQTILKSGRKTYATIRENKNPEYAFVIYFNGGWALSGFPTEQKAIDRANELNNNCNAAISAAINQTTN